MSLYFRWCLIPFFRFNNFATGPNKTTEVGRQWVIDECVTMFCMPCSILILMEQRMPSPLQKGCVPAIVDKTVCCLSLMIISSYAAIRWMCSVAEFPYVVFWIYLNVSNDRPCAGRMCLPQNWHQSQIILYEHVSQRHEGQGVFCSESPCFHGR